MYDSKTIAGHIKNARLQKNYSQDYVAAQLKISQNAYSKIECGYTKVTLERLESIAGVLSIDMVKLIEPGSLQADIEAISRMPIVPKLLELVCHTTKMRFAAIARVTEDRWIACSVRDEMAFGLVKGDELAIETTICNEIRQSGKAIVINEVDTDAVFQHHPIPAMYGFQSYISMPIIRRDGSFFGTLCAIDPKPAKVNNAETINLFKMLADLIALNLDSIDQLNVTNLIADYRVA